MSAFLPHETPARKDSTPPPSAIRSHTEVREGPHLATLPKQVLFVLLPLLVFFPTDDMGRTKDSPSAPHLKTAEGSFSDEANASRRRDYPPSPRATASTEKKSSTRKISAEPRQAHADPAPPSCEDRSDNPPPEPLPIPHFAVFETLPTLARSSARCVERGPALPPDVGETRPSSDRPLRSISFSGGRAGPGFRRFGALGLARFPRRKVKGDLPVLPHEEG